MSERFSSFDCDAPLEKQHRPVTEQEQFWQGAFGDEYTARNALDFQDRVPFFRQRLAQMPGLQSACELGANRGHNLRALHSVQPTLQLTGVEVNARAFQQLNTLAGISAVQESIQDFQPAQAFDLMLVCGVLIHLPPQDLPLAYEKLFTLSSRYVLINEYYSPTPVELPYRGHTGKLFKRDFGGAFWDAYPDQLCLLDYGFLWQRVTPAWDNTTWWLFEKIS